MSVRTVRAPPRPDAIAFVPGPGWGAIAFATYQIAPRQAVRAQAHDRKRAPLPLADEPRKPTSLPEAVVGRPLMAIVGSRRYDPAILLHCLSAARLSEAIGIFAASVRQACLALSSAALTLGLLVVI
jgi:hypothetical protein